MQILGTREEIAKSVKTSIGQGKSVGFVPTLGALHAGHMSLINSALSKTDVVVCSIFVNPTQFNDPKDLERYPRQLDADADLLRANGCDILFCPDQETVYPSGYQLHEYDLGGLDRILEGPLRPGHFNGVVDVVGRLFEMVRPTAAFFGKKDRQQLAIIRYVNEQYEHRAEIIGCETVREPDGLAMSSRNALLSKGQRQQAVALFKALCLAEEDAFALSLDSIRHHCTEVIKRHGLEPEYFDIIDPESLQSLESMSGVDHAVAVTAAYCGNIRLIDNLDLYR